MFFFFLMPPILFFLYFLLFFSLLVTSLHCVPYSQVATLSPQNYNWEHPPAPTPPPNTRTHVHLPEDIVAGHLTPNFHQNYICSHDFLKYFWGGGVFSSTDATEYHRQQRLCMILSLLSDYM